jgi:mRNA-degrading endonuclease RelE of RelBE toxin-antitoxin system
MEFLEFREFRDFTRTISTIATDRELLDLQIELCKCPDTGDLIPKTGGARKIRMRLPHRGKRGGARVIYYWQDMYGVIWLLKAYAKNETSDLTEKDKKAISNIIEEIKRGDYDQ